MQTHTIQFLFPGNIYQFPDIPFPQIRGLPSALAVLFPKGFHGVNPEPPDCKPYLSTSFEI